MWVGPNLLALAFCACPKSVAYSVRRDGIIGRLCVMWRLHINMGSFQGLLWGLHDYLQSNL